MFNGLMMVTRDNSGEAFDEGRRVALEETQETQTDIGRYHRHVGQLTIPARARYLPNERNRRYL